MVDLDEQIKKYEEDEQQPGQDQADLILSNVPQGPLARMVEVFGKQIYS